MTYHNHRVTDWADDKAQKLYGDPDVNKPTIRALAWLVVLSWALIAALFVYGIH